MTLPQQEGQSTASAKPTPQMILRRVALWDRQEVEAGVCAECSLSRLLTFYMAYDWEPGVSRELFAICDSCGLDLLTRSKALESQPAAERTALQTLDEERLLADFYLVNEKKFGMPNGDERAIDLELVKFTIGYIQGFLVIDAQERAGAKTE